MSTCQMWLQVIEGSPILIEIFGKYRNEEQPYVSIYGCVSLVFPLQPVNLVWYFTIAWELRYTLGKKDQKEQENLFSYSALRSKINRVN